MAATPWVSPFKQNGNLLGLQIAKKCFAVVSIKEPCLTSGFKDTKTQGHGNSIMLNPFFPKGIGL